MIDAGAKECCTSSGHWAGPVAAPVALAVVGVGEAGSTKPCPEALLPLLSSFPLPTSRTATMPATTIASTTATPRTTRLPRMAPG